MATSHPASSGTAAAAIRETIVGSHVWKFDDFMARTKDLGVGKSIKSSTFNVTGHDWYIECYPCGVDEENEGSVSLFLCLNVHKEQVVAGCELSVMEPDGWNRFFQDSIDYKYTFNADTLWRCGDTAGTYERDDLESLLKDDCFQVLCVVYVAKEFPAVPPLDLHRPLRDLVASGMPADLTFQVGGELFTVHRGLPAGPSAHVAASPTSGGASAAARICGDIDINDNVAGSHVLTIDGYSKTKKAFLPGDCISSESFVIGGQQWYMELYPSGQNKNDVDCLVVFLNRQAHRIDEELVKVRFELTVLTLAREIISSSRFCYAFTNTNYTCHCHFPFTVETEPLLGDCFHVKCEVTVVKEVTPMQPPDLHLHFRHLLASQMGADVEFEVGSDLISAHKCVLATRSTAFMAEFYGPAGKCSSTTTVTRVRIEDMEPRVFKALLHFIYTDTLPEVHQEEDKVVIAQGLLVAADRYGMERLKLICGDMLCSYIKDERTAITTLDLADKHGCRRLFEACMKFLAKVVAP